MHWKNISFERNKEPIMFPRDEELEKPDANILTAAKLQVTEQIRWLYGNTIPHPKFLKELPPLQTTELDLW